MRIATVLTPNGLRSRAALTPPTNDEPQTKKNSYEPQVETEFGNRFPAGQQASSPTRVLLQTAQTKLFLFFQDRHKGEESQVIVDQSEGTTSRTGENRGNAGMGGGHDVTVQSHLISSMA
jgi:hypothetical protein